MQETSDNVTSVATPRTRVPGKTSKVPPNLAPLDAVLPEDMRLAHTSTTLELMQAHASTNETKKGDTRRQRDVRRWRDEAGEVRDALLLRDEAERSAKMRLVNEMETVAVGGTDDDGTCDGTSATSTERPSSRAFGDERAPSRSRSVEWVQAYRPEQGAASATAKAREARKAALALARAAAKKKAEEKAARKAADPRSSFQKALDLTKRALGLESAYDAMRAGEAARREAAEAEKAAARSAARRDAALDANVLLRDELKGSVSPEREDALRARFRERVAEAGEVLAEDSRDDSRMDSRRAPSPLLCVIERGCAEIRVALNRDDFDDESDEGRGDDGRTDSDVDRDADTRRPRRDWTRARLGFGPSRLVATLSRGHAFAVDGAVLASLFGCPARATFAVVVRDPEDPEASADGACVLWELRDRAAFAAMAPSLLRRRAAFTTLWANVPALGAFSDPARAFFMDAARRVTRRPGAHFCVERAPCDALGVVETGRAIAHREAPEDGTEADAARSTQKCDAACDAASDTPPEDADATPEPGRVSGASRGSVSRRVILGEYARGDFFGARVLLRDDAGARGTPASQSTNAATTTARDVTSVLVVTRTAFRRLTRGAPGGFGSERNAISETERGTRTDPKTYDGRMDPTDFGNSESVVVEDAFAFAEGVSGPAARAEERAWRLAANRAPLENSAAARLLLDALLRTPPFVAVGRSVVANAEAAARRARLRRVRVGDTLFRRGDACVAAFIVQTGVVRLVGDDHGGDLADEHVEIPEEDDAGHPRDARAGSSRPRPFGDARASAAVRGGSFSSLSGTTKTGTANRRAPGAASGSRVVAELGPGDACGFAALPHPGCGAVWQCSASAAASPSPAGWVTVWELGMKDFQQTAGYAVDDKRHRFAALLRPESCAALAGLTERQRLRAADALDEATYESGERIVARGAPSADGVFVVTRGVAREETPFRASVADDISRAGREYSEYSARMSRGSDVSSARLLRRGDVFGTDGVFDGGTRERSVVAGGGVGARVSCAVWPPAALAQLGFLRRALEEFQRSA